MLIRARALAERVRGSLFYVPSGYVVAAAGLAWALQLLDPVVVAALPEQAWLFEVTVASARSLLSTIAGATITVAGIVFSVTVVSVQLASSQFSPRVLRGFLRDRLQQNVIGIVVGTFTYCLLVLATTRLTGPDDEGALAPSLPVTVALLLAVVSILAIVAFIDHSARSMQAGEIIRRVTEETRARVARLHPENAHDAAAPPTEEVSPPHGVRPEVVRAWRDGWVQQLDPQALLAATAEGSYVRLDTRVGAFVVEDTAVLTVWGEGVDIERVRAAIQLGNGRTMQQDVLFGIRQLVDVGLRSLSTGVNDPTTADEVIVHLAAVLADVLQRGMPPRVHVHDGRLLVIAAAFDHADHVHRAFDQLRRAAASQPAVLLRILRTLAQLDALMADADLQHRRVPLRRQAALVLATAEGHGHLEADLQPLRAAAAALGVDPDDLPG